MTYTVIVPKPFKKQLYSLPEDVQERILKKVARLSEAPRLPGSIKLKGYENEYRLRIGDYRVRYEIDDRNLTVLLLHCQHRKDVYKA